MPSRSDADLLAVIQRLVASGAIELTLDFAHLDKTDSPVSVQAESTRWLYGLVALALAAAWLAGLNGFVAASAVGVAIWFFWVRRDVARRIRQRVETRALMDVALWRRLWRFGGVRLAVGGGGAVCAAPSDNWMQYARDRQPVGDE